MRDKIIQIIKETEAQFNIVREHGKFDNPDDIPSREAMIADKLIENGWMRPPCKVGTELHFLWDRTQFGFPMQTLSTDDWQICSDIEGIYIDCKDIPISFEGTSRYILGKTVFLTKEEAEQALKGCEQE